MSSETTPEMRQMTTASHTPGPWFVRDSDDRNELRVRNSQGLSVALPVGGFDDDAGIGPTTYANAHLIAAAPEMKEACDISIGLLRVIRDAEPDAWNRIITYSRALEAWDKLKAAIAKAEGRSPQS